MSDTRLPENAIKLLADLQVQSMLFNMDVDWEALNLVPQNKYQEPIWISRWRARELSSDRQPNDYEGGEDGR